MARLYWEKMKMNLCCHRVSFFQKSPDRIRFEYFGEPFVAGDEVRNSFEQKEVEYKDSLDEIRCEYENKLQCLEEKLEKAYNFWVEDLQQQLPGFLLKLLNLIIPNVCIKEDNLAELIGPLLVKTSDNQNLVLRISQKDQVWLADLKKKFGDFSKITWTVDPTLKSGDIVLESDSGILDNRLQSRLKNLKERWAHYSK